MSSYTAPELDFFLADLTAICSSSIVEQARYISESLKLTPEAEISWLLRAIGLIDLTTLAGDDSWPRVQRLCSRALNPLNDRLADKINKPLTTAAVCVYPNMVEHAKEFLGDRLPIAAVATGFPSGQYPLETRLKEIEFAVQKGAKEIDIVLNRALVLAGDWYAVYQEVLQMKKACPPGVHLKSILAVGELESYGNIYKASMVCMLAGADFIKTSTGKETTINATLPVTLCMCRAIADYYRLTGRRVGYKPAGGLKTHEDALAHMSIVREVLREDCWLEPELFRIGASSLLNSLEARLWQLVFHQKQAPAGQLCAY